MKKIALVLSCLLAMCACSSKEEKQEPIVFVNDNENFIDVTKIEKDDKGFCYYEDDNYTSMMGIDVSEHQFEIDFEKVKEDGIQFVFLRIGCRGTQTGSIYKDACFEEYYENARKAGLLIGVYFYSQAVDILEAQEEANFVLNELGGRQIDLPIVFDYEDSSDNFARIKDLGMEKRMNNAFAFLNVIQSVSKEVMLYTNLTWATKYYVMSFFDNIPIWYAQYYKVPELEHRFDIWQYTDSGTVNGINTPVDLDIMFLHK